MKSTMSLRLSHIFCFVVSSQFAVTAQTNGGQLLIKPLENKVFIKENGQFDRKAKGLKLPFQEPVLYGIENGEFNAYFTAHGITFQFPERKKIEDQKIKNEPEEKSIETIWRTARMQWLNTDPSVELHAEQEQTSYYNYDRFSDSITYDFVPCYRKLRYTNLYPGVDAEFELPDEGGIKYKLLVHPNSVMPDMAFQWEGIENCFTDAQGNLHIKSTFGPQSVNAAWQLQDHAPNAVTAYTGAGIPVKYSVNGNVVQFRFLTQKISSPEGIVIDPWITNPNYPGYNRAFDIQEDAAGNVFVHGNYSQTSSGNSYHVQKYNSLGALQWTYITYSIFLGDIAVDNPGNVYIIGGYCAGKRQKLDPAGVQLWSVSGLCEEWRLAFNYSKTVLAICGYFINPGGNNIAQLDMNTGAISNQIAYNEETRSVSADCNGDMYSLHLPTSTLRKTNANFTPAGVVPSGLSLIYSGTGYATNPDYSAAVYQGINGNVIQGLYVYIYDGITLRRFNKITLTAVNFVTVPNGVNYQCSGLASDPCGNIYAGTTNSIVKYDSALNYMATIPTSGAVYDIMLGMSGEILACGAGFLGSFSTTCTTPAALTATTSTTPASCGSGGTATIAATGGIPSYNYIWQPGGQTTITATNLAPGTYTYTVNDAFCKTFQDTVTISPIPVTVANFSAASVCMNTSPPTQFTDLSTGASVWIWDFGDPASGPANNSILQNPSHTYSTSGSFTVTLIAATTNGCPDTLILAITVYPKPVATFTSPSVCFNNPMLFTDQTTGVPVQWSWDFGDGNSDTLQNPSHTYNNAGTFTVTLIATTSFGCVDTISQAVTVNPLPVAAFTSTTVCIGNATCFNDLSTISSGNITAWGWNFGDPNLANNVSNVQNPCITYTASGSYNVVLTVTSNNNCQSTVIIAAMVNALPVAAFTSLNVCQNFVTPFTDGSTGASQWYWDFGDGNTSTQQSPSHTYLGYGNYIVTLIATSPGNCSDTTYDTVTVYALPVVAFKSDSVCQRDTTTFTDLSFIASGSNTAWSWNFGDPASGANNTSALQNPTHVFSSGGNSTVTLTVTSNNGCVSAVALQAVVHPLPDAEFTSDPGPTITLTDEVLFNDLSTYAVQWFWNFGDSTLDSVQYPSHVYTDTGTYDVTLIVISVYGCVDTVQHLLEIKDFTFYIPNAFTPNGDDINEYFYGTGIGIAEYELSIFDRWGNMIFFCKVNDLPQTLACRWNGEVRGGTSNEKVQQDVYVWKVKLSNVFKKRFTYIGQVTVVK